MSNSIIQLNYSGQYRVTMQNYFKNKVAIVTGASSGIGKETARLLWKNGAKVVLTARKIKKLELLSQELPGSIPISADITQKDEIKNLMQKTVEQFGRIDILINNAGILLHKSIEESTEEEIRKVMEVNFFGAVRCIHDILPIMKKQKSGSILNVASIAGKIGLPNLGYYGSSKFALLGYSQALRQELKQYNIFVSVLCPGIVYTPMNQELLENARKEGRKIRALTPEEVAVTILLAVKKKKPEVIIPKFTRAFFWAHHFFPSLMETIVWRFRASSRK